MTNTFRVAKTTKNAVTSTDPNDFIFHSDYNTFKILAEGSLTSQTVNAYPKTFTLAHGQSFTPNFFAFCKFPDGKVATPNSNDYTAYPFGDVGYGNFNAEVDATNIYFMFTAPIVAGTGSTGYNVDLKYYIFEVPI